MMSPVLSALAALLPLPRPAAAGPAGLAFTQEGWTPPPERRPLRRHVPVPDLLAQKPRPRQPLGTYVAQGAAMLLAMLFVFWLAGLEF